MRERAALAPYAMPSGDSRGRVHGEEEHAYRTAFQRDRDRILHTKAFRRLKHKTQVFISHEGDHYRTRLTHSIEASQISRAIAHNLLHAAGVLAGGTHAAARGATLRRKIITVPARLVRPQRRPLLHLPSHWPWADHWLTLWRNTIGYSPPNAATP